MKTLKLSMAIFGLFISSQIFAAIIPGVTGTYSENSIPVSALPATVFDGNTTTNAKQFVGYQNIPIIIIDLGAKYDLASIKFFWGTTYYATAYQISTSPDNITWINRLYVSGNTNNTSAGDLRTLSPSPTYVQYIKLSGFNSNNSSNYFINLHEIQVDGVITACVNNGAFKNLSICENANFNLAVTANTLSANSITTPDLKTTGNTYFKYNTVSLMDVTSGYVKIYKKLVVDAKIEAEEMEVKVIGANEINVKMDNLADYVFKPGYKLATLNEVENFIAENNHLPNMPSAQSVKENGMNVAEMNNLLLQKVEELTLYMVDLNKQLQDAKGEIERLSSSK